MPAAATSSPRRMMMVEFSPRRLLSYYIKRWIGVERKKRARHVECIGRVQPPPLAPEADTRSSFASSSEICARRAPAAVDEALHGLAQADDVARAPRARARTRARRRLVARDVAVLDSLRDLHRWAWCASWSPSRRRAHPACASSLDSDRRRSLRRARSPLSRGRHTLARAMGQ